jgi:hypothetical protein
MVSVLCIGYLSIGTLATLHYLYHFDIRAGLVRENLDRGDFCDLIRSNLGLCYLLTSADMSTDDPIPHRPQRSH